MSSAALWWLTGGALLIWVVLMVYVSYLGYTMARLKREQMARRNEFKRRMADLHLFHEAGQLEARRKLLNAELERTGARLSETYRLQSQKLCPNKQEHTTLQT